jgi:starvation-inducible DNA-binding protein
MPTHTHKTLNSVPKKAKPAVIDLANARLADGIDLALAIKQAHWNIKGPTFIGLHLLLDDFRKDIDEHVDTIAERAVQLGGTALGTIQTVHKGSSLKPYPKDIYAIHDQLKALIEHFGAAARLVRESIDEADAAGDRDLADIFTAYSRFLDKSLWFLEAHVQESS